MLYHDEVNKTRMELGRIIKLPETENMPNAPVRNPLLQLTAAYFFQEARRPEMPKDDRSDATVVNEDKAAVAEAVTAAAVSDAGYENLDAAKNDNTAFVFLGHGTSHTAKVSYSQMQTQMSELGYDNVFIGTVEGEPEDTAREAVIEKIAKAGYTKVVLRPLMVVAGDHANNDMAGGEEDSWLSMFEASGNFESVETQIAGLGEISAIQDIYISHTAAVIGE